MSFLRHTEKTSPKEPTPILDPVISLEAEEISLGPLLAAWQHWAHGEHGTRTARSAHDQRRAGRGCSAAVAWRHARLLLLGHRVPARAHGRIVSRIGSDRCDTLWDSLGDHSHVLGYTMSGFSERACGRESFIRKTQERAHRTQLQKTTKWAVARETPGGFQVRWCGKQYTCHGNHRPRPR